MKTKEQHLYLVKLSCGHKVITAVLLMLQHPKDEHFILCPSCRKDPLKNIYGRVPTSWQQVTSYREIPIAKQPELFDVFRELPLIVPGWILRLQRTVPRNRKRPFPYARGI